MDKLVNHQNNIIKYLGFLLLTLFLTQPLFAQQLIIDESEPWTKDQSPYLITDNILVKNLTIEPGVVVLFNGNYSFDINGMLIAEGTKSDSIIFKPSPINFSGWQGISFDSVSSESRMAYCRVEGTNTYGMQLINSSPHIEKCDVVNNRGDGLKISGGEATLSNCFIMDNSGYGIDVNTGADVQFTNSVFSRNGKNGVYINNNGYAELKNCIVSYNTLDGILLIDTIDSLSVINCVVAKNSFRGIRSWGTLSIINSIIYNNTLLSENSGGLVEINFSYLPGWNGEYQGNDNIISTLNPFDNENSFTLSAASQCIDAGNPDPDYHDVCFPPSLGDSLNDIGAYGGPTAYKWYDPLYVTPRVLDFGNVTVDSRAIKQLVIKNYSDSILTIKSIDFHGEDADNFSSEPAQVSLDPFDSLHVGVHFIPNAIGFKRATLYIQSGAGNDSIALTGYGIIAKILVYPSLLQFGNVVVNDSITKDIRISNIGNDTLRIFSIKNALQVFRTREVPPSLLLLPSQDDTLSVTFQPDSNLTYLDSLQIISNDPDETTLFIPIDGTGLAPILTGTPSLLNYGEVLIYHDSLMNFELANTGNDTLHINSKDLLGPDSSLFTIIQGQEEISIPPDGKIDTVAIRFAPDSVGSKSAIFTIFSNDPFKNPIDFPLTGIGVSPEFISSHNSINFGRVPVDTTKNFILEIFNPGTHDLTIDSTKISGIDSLLFSLNQDIQGLTIPPAGGPDTIEVIFNPGSEGLKSADLKIYHNDLDHNPSVLSLSGEGVIAPEIHTKPTAIDFGALYISNHRDSSIILYNKGQVTLHIDSIHIVDDTSASFSMETVDERDTIAVVDDSLKVNITFSPNLVGDQNASLRIYNDDPLNSPLIIPLVGSGKIDETPATIRIDTSQIKLTSDSSFTIHAAIGNDETRIQSTQLLFRQGGELSYHDTSFTHMGDSIWSVEIPGKYVTERGFEYIIETYHGGRITTHPSDSTEIPAVLLVDIPYLPFNNQTQSGRYQMISVPVNTLNQNLSDLFEDNLGAYDNKVYRFFDWDPVDSVHIELSTMGDTLLPGQAVWLITSEARSLDLQNCQSVPTGEEYAIALHQGWNMVGAPFAFPVDWDSVDVTAGQLITPWFYDVGGWMDASHMEMVPFHGYAIHSNDTSMLRIPAKESGFIGTKPVSHRRDEGEWQIQIKATKDYYHDRDNYAGVRDLAQSDLDEFDIHEPPVIGKFVTLFFENSSGKGTLKRLAGDYRNPDDDSFIFNFRIMSNFLGRTKIEFIPHNLPEDLGWMVISPESHIKYPKGTITTEKMEAIYRLIVGSDEFLAKSFSDYNIIPVEFKLTQNFPNPFNPETTILYQLPEETQITIEIFDILGRRIRILLNDEYSEAGYHRITWDGRNQNKHAVASGIYLLNFRSDIYNKVIKMVLQR